MKQTIPILLYHSVSKPTGSAFDPWCMPPNHFEEHMALIHAKGYQSLTVEELMRHKRDAIPIPKKAIVITFDDGLRDFHTSAFPILKKYNLRATIFIVTSLIGKTTLWLEREGDSNREMMNWDEVHEINNYGIECASHGMTHAQLDILSKKQVKSELYKSKQILEDRLGSEVVSIAYPHGYFNHTVKRVVQESGYLSACAVKNAMSYANDDPYALARIDIRNHVDADLLKLYLETDLLPIASTNEGIKTKLWRFSRRCGLDKLKVLEGFLKRQQRRMSKQLYR